MKASLVILPLAAVLLSVPAQAQQRIDLKELLKPYDVKTKTPGGRGTVAISADGLKVGTSTESDGPTFSVSDSDRTGFCM